MQKESGLVVQTYNSTGILEPLSLGIPSAIYIDLKVTPLRETSVPYYDELKSVGIFHDIPESAAEHVNAIWEDVDHFTKQYCNLPDNILD